MTRTTDQDDLFNGLNELVASTFPKKCANCGRVYENVTDYVAFTLPVRPDHQGFKESVDDDGSRIVELFRNCACGSTLLENFYNRRETSEAGLKRRQRFDHLLNQLIAAGADPKITRTEMLKLIRGQKNNLNDLIAQYVKKGSD